MVVLLVVVAVAIWWHSTFSEDTDDAQVNGHLIQVSSRIAGQVLKVDVEENQFVKQGDIIAELDPADYRSRSKMPRLPWPARRPTPLPPT